MEVVRALQINTGPCLFRKGEEAWEWDQYASFLKKKNKRKTYNNVHHSKIHTEES